MLAQVQEIQRKDVFNNLGLLFNSVIIESSGRHSLYFSVRTHHFYIIGLIWKPIFSFSATNEDNTSIKVPFHI